MGPRLDSRGRRVARVRRVGRGSSFNGAAAGQPRKGTQRSIRPARFGASMGPRLDSRGRTRDQRACWVKPARFNGAAAGQPRKGLHQLRRRPNRPSFNGAAAGQPRKARRRCGQEQFGHASMGPRLDSRGRHKAAKSCIGTWTASMGARLDSRGRLVRHKTRKEGLARLQWGRGWTAAEGGQRAGERLECHPLQWGRGWTAAEGDGHSTSRGCSTSLQWGRGWTAAEGPRRGRPPARRLCFNGAAAGQPRKAHRSAGVPAGDSEASMGPRLDSRGRAPPP